MISYLTQSIQNTIFSTCSQYKKHWDLLHFLKCEDFKILCVFYPHRTSPFGPVTFQVLKSHLWAALSVLDGAGLWPYYLLPLLTLTGSGPHPPPPLNIVPWSGLPHPLDLPLGCRTGHSSWEKESSKSTYEFLSDIRLGGLLSCPMCLC